MLSLLDHRSVALFRIALGATIALDVLLVRLPGVRGPSRFPLQVSEPHWRATVLPPALQLHRLAACAHPAATALVHAAYLAAAAALTVGFRSRWSALTCAVLAWSIEERTPFVQKGGHLFLTMVTLLLS